MVIREGLTVVFLFLYLLWMNWKLTLVMLAILPVIAVMVTTASRKFRKQSKKIQVAMGDVTRRLGNHPGLPGSAQLRRRSL